ncbi:MAG: hypothetical protein R3F39_05590 [Myxococcota bacterium]
MRTLPAVRGARAIAVSVVVAATLTAWSTSAADAAGVRVDIGIMGGTMAEWDAFGEAGNAFGLRAGVRVGSFDVALALAGVMPAGRVQARFASIWAEGRWHPFMERLLARDVPLSPFLLVGAGVATADGAEARDFDGFDAVRWTPDRARPVIMAGLGLRYGANDGLYGSLDARAYNLSHGGLVLAIGYAF